MFWLFEDVRLTLYEIVKEQKIVFRPCCRSQIYGDDRDRTGNLLLAKQALYQLSYVPENLWALPACRQAGTN